ncbi:MAG: phage tail protein [Oxalobacter formigenes]|nr:phage tail protein [Oxalobacter formigenes]
MDMIFLAGASDTPPAMPETPSRGYPVNGDPSLGREATKPGAYWYYAMMMEIINAIKAAGIEPDAKKLNQLAEAIQRIALPAGGKSGQVLIFNGETFVWSDVIDTYPVGTLAWWSLQTPPSIKWMERNGDILDNPVAYAEWFKLFGNAFGGDGLTTSALPDDRGLVMRGWDHGRGYDSARPFGSEQGDAIRNIAGNFYELGTSYVQDNGGATGVFSKSVVTAIDKTNIRGTSSNQLRLVFDTSGVVPTASENRMKNRAYLPIIKVLP